MSATRLLVPFESQLDNRSGQGWRECFSSSCAMLARFWGAVGSDDAYNLLRQGQGDTTDPMAQIRTLRGLGLQADFWTFAGRRMIEQHISAGRPVAVGWLHRGTLKQPTGGHWSVVVGVSDDSLWIHDPYGEPLLVTGGHVPGSRGESVKCSWPNFQRRWEVEGPNTGWLVTCSKPAPAPARPAAASRKAA